MPIRPRASRSVDTPEAKASPRPDHRPKPHQIATRSLAPSRNQTDLSTCAPPAAGAIASGNLYRRRTRHRHQSAPFHDTKTNSQSPPCPAPCPGLSGGSGGCCPSRERVHSGGLKQIRGSWLCSGPGLITWRPPVYTGPRECKNLDGRVRARHTLPFEYASFFLHPGKKRGRCPRRAMRASPRVFIQR